MDIAECDYEVNYDCKNTLNWIATFMTKYISKGGGLPEFLLRVQSLYLQFVAKTFQNFSKLCFKTFQNCVSKLFKTLFQNFSKLRFKTFQKYVSKLFNFLVGFGFSVVQILGNVTLLLSMVKSTQRMKSKLLASVRRKKQVL